MSRYLIAIAIFLSALAQPAWCDSAQESFLPIWKLLNNQEKQQFISGYLHGWQDAAKVTDIAIGYVRENPQKAVEGLQSIRSVYEVGDLRPADIAQQIERFFADSSNKDASLSKAISFARAQLR
ncbi:MAG: hypothetical protein K1X79_14310 [Oligoflexia bacterium]|nr:hypothetical protein [Oligoflexia bacterium]